MARPCEALPLPRPPTSQCVWILPPVKNCTNSQELSWCEGQERVSLQEHEGGNEEMIFLDVLHRLIFVFIFYGEMILFISFLQIPCEMYAERMPMNPMDEWIEGWMDGPTQADTQLTFSYPPASLFFLYKYARPIINTSFNPDS